MPKQLTQAQTAAINTAIQLLAAHGLSSAQMLAEVAVRDLVAFVRERNADLRDGDEEMSVEDAYETFVSQEGYLIPAFEEAEEALEERMA